METSKTARSPARLSGGRGCHWVDVERCDRTREKLPHPQALVLGRGDDTVGLPSAQPDLVRFSLDLLAALVELGRNTVGLRPRLGENHLRIMLDPRTALGVDRAQNAIGLRPGRRKNLLRLTLSRHAALLHLSFDAGCLDKQLLRLALGLRPAFLELGEGSTLALGLCLDECRSLARLRQRPERFGTGRFAHVVGSTCRRDQQPRRLLVRCTRRLGRPRPGIAAQFSDRPIVESTALLRRGSNQLVDLPPGALGDRRVVGEHLLAVASMCLRFHPGSITQSRERDKRLEQAKHRSRWRLHAMQRRIVGVSNDPDLIQSGETAYRLHLSEAELKVTHTALKSLFDDLGHDEADIREIVRGVLAKLPDEHSIRAIDLEDPR